MGRNRLRGWHRCHRDTKVCSTPPLHPPSVGVGVDEDGCHGYQQLAVAHAQPRDGRAWAHAAEARTCAEGPAAGRSRASRPAALRPSACVVDWVADGLVVELVITSVLLSDVAQRRARSVSCMQIAAATAAFSDSCPPGWAMRTTRAQRPSSAASSPFPSCPIRR
jgi:hypothetical protein